MNISIKGKDKEISDGKSGGSFPLRKKRKSNADSITKRWITDIFSIVFIVLTVVAVTLSLLVCYTIDRTVNDYINATAENIRMYFSEYIKINNYDFNVTAHDIIIRFSDMENIRTELYPSTGNVTVTSDGYASASSSVTDNHDSVITSRDPETGERLLIATFPLKDNGGTVLGRVRLLSSLTRVNLQKTVTVIIISVIDVIIMFLVAMSGLFFVRSIVNPLKQISATAKKIAKGNLSASLSKSRNDEVGELTDSINHMAEELSKIDQMKNDFISSISHELRTPLTAIKGWNETLIATDPVQDPETITMGLNVIAAEADRLAAMVEELLDYSKLQSGKMTLNLTSSDISELASESVTILKQKAAHRSISLIFTPSPLPSVIEGDTARLKQVFINIIDNAIKHSPENSKIEISCRKIERGASLTVRDYGEGIRAEDLPFIKQRFYKGKSTAPGSGLGLAISDSIVKLHGGYLDIYSEEGRGTEVIVSLPERISTKKKGERKHS